MYTSLTPKELYDRAAELKNYKLCYVDCSREFTDDYDLISKTLTLYFTPLELNSQWGDDWDDAPYEHNAGVPYDVISYSNGDWLPFHIIACEMELDPADAHRLMTPEDFCYGIEVSVQDINSGAVAWLYSSADNKRCNGIAIHAGESPESVADKISLILSK